MSARRAMVFTVLLRQSRHIIFVSPEFLQKDQSYQVFLYFYYQYILQAYFPIG